MIKPTIELIQEPFPHAKIKNIYTEEELSLIWRELNFYTDKNKLYPATNLGGKFDQLTGLPFPKHTGIQLDAIYANNRNISDILRINRKIFDKEILNTISSLSPLLWDIKQTNTDFTTIKYYEDGDLYNSHVDNPRFTFLSYFYKEPKAFEGGDLYFEDFNYTIPIENNMLVFFKGCIPHTSTKIKMKLHTDKKFSGYGKYTIAQFLDHRS